MTDSHLTIIGGGAAATLFLAALARQDDMPPAPITVFDQTGIFGTGIAYGTTHPGHLMNVRSSALSAFENEPEHFIRWLANGHSHGPDDFVPRLIYGAYLRHILDEAAKELTMRGHSIAFRHARIMDIGAIGGAVIQATGNSSPVAIPGADSLTKADGYHAEPWHAEYATIKNTDHIVILGTGLSMIDAAVALDAAGFEGTITAISRHGLIPATHTALPAPDFAFSCAAFPTTALELLRIVRAHAGAAARQNIPWQAAINSLRPVTNAAWLALPPPERKKLRRALPFWNIHRHRMAPEIAALVDKKISGKNLRIVRGRIERIERRGARLVVRSRRGDHDADHVINCLGYRSAPPLAPIDDERVFALGPVLSGQLLETTAIPEIRSGAAALAKRLAFLWGQTGQGKRYIKP